MHMINITELYVPWSNKGSGVRAVYFHWHLSVIFLIVIPVNTKRKENRQEHEKKSATYLDTENIYK